MSHKKPNSLTIHDCIAFLDKQITNPSVGLPKDIFFFISRNTPMANVDLLIKDEKGRTLLAWRDDEFAGTGWHVLGGIVRFKENLTDRVRKVAEAEVGAEIQFNPTALAVNQVICAHDNRGHFISILYNCFLSEKYVPQNKGLSSKTPGFLKWHDTCPKNLVKVHEMYRKYI